MTLSFVNIPAPLYTLRLRGALELSILGLVSSFGQNGLVMSNGDLASFFHVDKRSVKRAIQNLKSAGWIKEVGNRVHKLVASGDLLSLLTGDFTSPEGMTKVVKMGDRNVPYKELSKKRRAQTEKPVCLKCGKICDAPMTVDRVGTFCRAECFRDYRPGGRP